MRSRLYCYCVHCLIAGKELLWPLATQYLSSSFGSGSDKKGTVLKFDDVVEVLLSEDMRRKNPGTSSGDALVTSSKGRTQERGRNNQRGRSKSNKRSKSRGKKGCWHCGKEGHKIKNFGF